MVSSKMHELLQEANSPDTELGRLHQIVDLGDETLSATVALNPSSDKHLLDKLSALSLKVVHQICQSVTRNIPNYIL